ncbi:MAG TPA: FAD-binding oxidoreductase [Victivallales bacterium]|nr:FAD-binding oxidoreductase [Victivallales bacterium]
MKKNYDVIVIGAGSVGQPTTFFLAEKGLKVLCIDQYASSGQGQNKASIGGIRATHSDPAKIMIGKLSREIFSNWKEKHNENIGWKKGGYCFPVFREEEEKLLKNILPIQKQYGLNIDWVDADLMRKLIPGINPENLRGGTFSPDDGQISPLLTAEAIEGASVLLGAEFKFNSKIIDLVTENGKVLGVKTEKETIFAGAVVNTAGANGMEVSKMAGIDIPIIPDSHEAGISAPVGNFLDPLVVDLRPGSEGKTSNFYFGQNHEGAIIFCYTPKHLFKGKDRRVTSEFMPVIAKRLVSLIPKFKNLRIRRLWRGLYPMTPDGVAIVGKPEEVDNFYLGVGMCGQGLMMGPGVGKNLAELIAAGKPLIDQKVFNTLSPNRDFYAGKTESLK